MQAFLHNTAYYIDNYGIETHFCIGSQHWFLNSILENKVLGENENLKGQKIRK